MIARKVVLYRLRASGQVRSGRKETQNEPNTDCPGVPSSRGSGSITSYLRWRRSAVDTLLPTDVRCLPVLILVDALRDDREYPLLVLSARGAVRFAGICRRMERDFPPLLQRKLFRQRLSSRFGLPRKGYCRLRPDRAARRDSDRHRPRWRIRRRRRRHRGGRWRRPSRSFVALFCTREVNTPLECEWLRKLPGGIASDALRSAIRTESRSRTSSTALCGC